MGSSSHTWGSDEGIDAVMAAMPERYIMELSRGDMEAVLRGLVGEAVLAVCSHAEECPDDCWRMLAMGLASSIAETVGVEWV